MDYKKKYEKAERLYRTANADQRYVLESLFPELKESEDEKIKKEIISFIQDDIDEINLKVSGDYDDRDEDDIAHQNWCKKAIAWLENIPYTIDHEKREGFHLGYKAGLEKQGKQKPTIEMKSAEESLGIDSETYNKIVDECIYGEQKPQRMVSAEAKEALYDKPAYAWSEEDEEHIHSLLDRLEGMCKKDATFTATRFAVNQDIDWLKSLKQKIGE